MRCPLENMNKQAFQIVKAVGRSADKKSIDAFLVGGIVRDLFLRRENIDIDVVVQGDAITFARQLASEKGLAVKAHRRFGTATIADWKGLYVDVVTARSETYPRPGALPVVQKASLREDIFRRDFTINALGACINRKDFGKLVDVCDGLHDLKKGIVRVFHHKSFQDDPTRILRGVRFEQRFGFRMAPGTLRLLKDAIAKKTERTVSEPRYFQEFARGLAEDAPGQYIRRLKVLGALDFLRLPGRVPVTAVLRLDKKRWKDPLTKKLAYLALLYAGADEKALLRHGERFQWSRSEKRKILNIVNGEQ